jgi:AmiR/NasT family two-component response regulator
MNKRVLIAENESIVAIDMKYILEKRGFSVVDMVFSGEDAIQRAEEVKPDLFITGDFSNEEVQGIDAVLTIRNRCDIPVIYITTDNDTDIMQKVNKIGKTEIMTKPFSESDLSKTVETLLSKIAVCTVNSHDIV